MAGRKNLIPAEAMGDTSQEKGKNRSQFVTGSQKHRDPALLPYAFTEHGAIMAATIVANLKELGYGK